MTMAMVAGVSCRAPSVATFIRLLPCCSAGCPTLFRTLSSSAFPSVSRENSVGASGSSRVTFLGSILGFREERRVRNCPRRSGLFVRAINVSGPGAVDSPLMKSMQEKIKEGLNAESVTVKDAYGDGRHVSIDVVSSSFEGLSAVNRQRAVYKAIWEELQGVVHAVDQLKTRTPSEAANSPDRL